MKKINTILFSSLLIFAMSGMAFAVDPWNTGDNDWSGPSQCTPPPPPVVQAASPDPMLPLNKTQELTEITPTSFVKNITHDIPLNLAGTYMKVTPLEKTMIVNNMPDAFTKGSVGAIAINDSADHMLAVSEFTPIGAASQVGNNGGETVPADANYDFIIPEAIVE